jgi:hypothetical protein
MTTLAKLNKTCILNLKKNLNNSQKENNIKKIINILKPLISEAYINSIIDEKINENQVIKPKIKNKIKEDECVNISSLIPQENINLDSNISQERFKDFRNIIHNKFGIKELKIKTFSYKGHKLLEKLDTLNTKNYTKISKNIVRKIINNKFQNLLDENKDILESYKLKRFINIFYIPYDDNFLLTYEYQINNKNGYLSLEINMDETNFEIINIYDDFKFNYKIDNNKLVKNDYLSSIEYFLKEQNEYYNYLVSII